MDHVALDHQVFVDEVSREGVVGVDTADLRGRKNDNVRLLVLHEFLDC